VPNRLQRLRLAPVDSAPDPLIGSRIGPFRVIERLGAGGMGVVYRGEDTRLGRAVALKILPSDLVADDERRLRFLREARAAAKINHPAIAQVFDIGEHEGTVWIALEMCPGGTLRDRMKRAKMGVSEALRIAHDVAGALEAAARVGIVHRDLKPDNIMFDEAGRTKVLDFGLARINPPEEAVSVDDATVEGFQTQQGRILGTPGYMSPEQATGTAVDSRADQFSLGVVLYEMISGKRPFKGRSSMEIIISTTRDAPVPISDHDISVPASAQAIVERCLAKSPDQRYPDAKALLAAIDDALSKRVRPDKRARPARDNDVNAATALDLEAPTNKVFADRAPTADPAPQSANPPRSSVTQTGTHGGTRPTRSTGVLVGSIAAVIIGTAGAAMMLAQEDAENLPRIAATAKAGKTAAEKGLWPGWPPVPALDDKQAVKVYVEALSELRSGRLMLYRTVEDAVKRRPDFAEAWLFLAFVQWNNQQTAAGRKAFNHARRLKEKLHPVWREVMHAMAPVVLQTPPDIAEAERRFRAAIKNRPKSAVLPFSLATLLPPGENYDDIIDLLDRALAIDPEFINAAGLRIEALAAVGRVDDALQAAADCRKKSPDSIYCTSIPARIFSQQGKCEDVIQMGRLATAADPEQAAGPIFVARGLAAMNRPIPAVEAAVEQGLKLVRIKQMGDRIRGVFRYRVAALKGDFTTAIAEARKLIAQGKGAGHRIRVGGPIALAAMALLESGEREQAAKLAADFIARMDAYEQDPVGNVESLAGDPVPRLLRVLAETRHLDNVRWQNSVQRWLTGWEEAGIPRLSRRFAWPYGYARAVAGPAEATLAVAEYDPKLPIPLFLPSAMLAADIGRTFLHAGRMADARKWLELATHNCDILAHPIAGVRAFFDRGMLHERDGNTAEACKMYKQVLTRWPDPQPRSMTVNRARDRRAALGCDQPTTATPPGSETP